jgi:hypothetical protein
MPTIVPQQGRGVTPLLMQSSTIGAGVVRSQSWRRVSNEQLEMHSSTNEGL